MKALLAWMAVAIVAVATVAFWDEQRESAAALDDYGEEQASVATAVAVALSARLDSMSADERAAIGGAPLPPSVLAVLSPVAIPGLVVPLVSTGDPGRLYAPDGTETAASVVSAGLAAHQRWVHLGRPDAAATGLPMRTAMAGLASLDVDGRRWGVAVVATARDMRDRQKRAQWRLLLGVGVASGLVFAFGGLALRKQRKQLELARELAVAEAERKRDERLVRADKLATMGALATGITHEISTPLAVIAGRADQLAGKVTDDRGKKALADILEQSDRITRIIRGFLTLARGDSPALEHVDAELIAQNAVALVEHRFAKSKVALRSNLGQRLPRIACEPRLFEQAIANLLLNACDACAPGGEVELEVRTDGKRVAFIVIDDGAGIPPEIADRVTEPFFTTKPTGKGTGLGLAITSEIVKHHNGTLTIEPRSGDSGTRVCIQIPGVVEVRNGRAGAQQLTEVE